jgi:SAM-dependent methyltransferase
MVETSLYRQRFSAHELQKQRAFWVPICRFLQRWIPEDGATLDLGAGYCHFINGIRSGKKLALDINDENLRAYAAENVQCIVSTGADLSMIPTASVDAVFASNVYEHFQSREQVAESFAEVRRILRAGGVFVILQPNFAYCANEYFDFFDHRLIFTHRGIVEGLVMSDFDIERVIPQFLPYTSKSRLPQAAWMVDLYLRVPLAWRILGGQMLVVARKGRE